MKRPSFTGTRKARSAHDLDHILAPDDDPATLERTTAPITTSRRRCRDQRYVDIVDVHALS